MYDRVVIAVDGSEAAERAAQRGFRFALMFDAEVDVLHVLERKRNRLVKSADEEAELQERGERILDDVAELALDTGVDVSTHLAEGEPAASICEHAVERDASLITLGRQGLSGLGDRLFGGVTERVPSTPRRQSWSSRVTGTPLQVSVNAFSFQPTVVRTLKRPVCTELRSPAAAGRRSTS
ncbi:universal stress protein [Natronomonas salina]|uniref:universal stress protein n=1 Tax=Natronomonas salina TaxID=1710540 RepID=UPI001FE67942|nr:universal stress protein [Natronomonas salina]